MYTVCANILCGKIFMGEAQAFRPDGKPLCAGCFNEIAYGKPQFTRPENIPMITEVSDNGFGYHGFPPPTMG